MNINNQAFAAHGVTVQDYLDWCEKKKWQAYKSSTKREFFARLTDGRLVKDKSTGKLLEKRVKRKKVFGR